MPAVGADRVGLGPLEAGILDLVSEPEHRGDTGKRGRLCVWQPPTNRVDIVSRSPAAIRRFPRFIRAEAYLSSASSWTSMASPWAISAARCAAISAKAGSIAQAELSVAAAGMAATARVPTLATLTPAATARKRRRLVDRRVLIHGASFEKLPCILRPPGIAGDGGPFRALALRESVPPRHSQNIVEGHRLGWDGE